MDSYDYDIIIVGSGLKALMSICTVHTFSTQTMSRCGLSCDGSPTSTVTCIQSLRAMPTDIITCLSAL